MKSVKEKQTNTFDDLKDDFDYENKMEAPRLKKVVISSGIGSITDKEKIEIVQDRLAKITGQKPVACSAKKSVGSFDIRTGDVIGYKVTLRGQRMYSFIDRLINIALPRTKDFRGLARRSVDEMGNYTLGIEEHTAFPETSDEELKNVFGFSVTVVTTAESEEEAIAFLEHLGFPFQKEEEKEEAEAA